MFKHLLLIVCMGCAGILWSAEGPDLEALYRQILQGSSTLQLEESSGGYLLLSGQINSASDVEKVNQIRKLDEKSRLVVDITALNEEKLLGEALEFFRSHGFERITLKLMGRVVFLSGEVYDLKRQTQLINLAETYFQSFECTINTAALNITTRKIAVRVTFLDVNKSKLRDFGLTVDSPVTWSVASSALNQYLTDKSFDFRVNELSGVINILQKSNVADVVYENRLATLSGEKAEFQQGGELNVRIYSNYNTDLKAIEYGFQLQVVPYAINDELIGLDFEMSQTLPKNNAQTWTDSSKDKDISKYLTKSKYTLSAGSSVVVSSYAVNKTSTQGDGLPWLSDLPWWLGGTWLFSSTTTDNSEHEILLILSVDWEDPTESGQMLFSAQSDPAIQKITEQFRKEVQFLEKLHPQPEPKPSESEPESKDAAEGAK